MSTPTLNLIRLIHPMIIRLSMSAKATSGKSFVLKSSIKSKKRNTSFKYLRGEISETKKSMKRDWTWEEELFLWEGLNSSRILATSFFSRSLPKKFRSLLSKMRKKKKSHSFKKNHLIKKLRMMTMVTMMMMVKQTTTRKNISTALITLVTKIMTKKMKITSMMILDLIREKKIMKMVRGLVSCLQSTRSSKIRCLSSQIHSS